MRIDANLLNRAASVSHSARAEAAEERVSFGELLQESLRKLNDLQQEADAQALALALGQTDNLHEVMIAGERAQLALHLAIAVRNKIVEAYQEISRMQI